MSKIVVLDPGHEITTLGKASPDGNYREFEFNWDMALKMKYYLESCGVKVILTRSAVDEASSLKQRVTVANNAKADIFVSLHSNAYTNNWNTATGWEIYSYNLTGAGYKLAKSVENRVFPAMKNEYGLINRGVKDGKDLYVINSTSMPAILIEHGFHTNKGDIELLKSQVVRHYLAYIEAIGICEYLDVKYSNMHLVDVLRTVTKKGDVIKDASIFDFSTRKLIGFINAGRSIDIVERYNGDFKILYGTEYGIILNAAVSANIVIEDNDVEIKQGQVTTTKLNVRSGPGTSYDVIGILDKGVTVDIHPVTTSSGWYQITYNDGIGYVSNVYITLIEPVKDDEINKPIIKDDINTEVKTSISIDELVSELKARGITSITV